MMATVSCCTVPKITVIVGNAIGPAHYLMVNEAPPHLGDCYRYNFYFFFFFFKTRLDGLINKLSSGLMDSVCVCVCVYCVYE